MLPSYDHDAGSVRVALRTALDQELTSITFWFSADGEVSRYLVDPAPPDVALYGQLPWAKARSLAQALYRYRNLSHPSWDDAGEMTRLMLSYQRFPKQM